MRIAMIGHKRIPGREGGIEVVVEELSTRMAKLGNEVIVYNRKSKKIKTQKKYRDVKLVTIPTIEKKATDAVAYSFLSSIHALFGHYDVIHYHAIGPSLFLIIPHMFGIRTVVTVHGLNYKTPKWKGIGSKVMQWGERITARYADEVIVLSYEQQEYFKRKYNRETSYIPNGVTLQELLEPNIIYEKYGLKKNGYILFLSRLVPGKGVEYLIRAYKEIKTELPLIIAGDAPFVTDFAENIKKEAAGDKRIHFIGFVKGMELQELYSNARLFVFPSEAEGMPMCLLEALSYNTPCLVSDIPENTEVGKEYVTTFKSKDVDDLVQKMKEFLSESYSQKVDSRSYIKKYYDWDSVVQKTLEVYKNK